MGATDPTTISSPEAAAITAGTISTGIHLATEGPTEAVGSMEAVADTVAVASTEAVGDTVAVEGADARRQGTP